MNDTATINPAEALDAVGIVVDAATTPKEAEAILAEIGAPHPDDLLAPFGRTPGGRPVSGQRWRARLDTAHEGTPASWPRRERDRPGRTHRKRKQRGRSSSPGVVRLRKEIAQTEHGRRTTQRIPRVAEFGRSAPEPGWYRSKRGRLWHLIDDEGNARCGSPVTRTAGPRTSTALPHGIDSACSRCTVR